MDILSLCKYKIIVLVNFYLEKIILKYNVNSFMKINIPEALPY